jgi:hypothetical protein
MKIDWKKYDCNATKIDLSFNNITEMNWEFCPPGSTKISLDGNQITCLLYTSDAADD